MTALYERYATPRPVRAERRWRRGWNGAEASLGWTCEEPALSMPKLVPGHAYDREEVLREVGVAAVKSAFAHGRDRLALFAKPGDTDDEPGFPERAVLHWPGQVPARAVERGIKVLVFVERGDGTVRFVGEAHAVSYSAGHGAPRDVRFAVRPPLSREAWLELIAGRIPPAGPAPEAPIAALTAASGPAERWTALLAFIERWYGKPIASRPHPEGGPGHLLLRRMIGVAAAHPEVFRQNQRMRAEELALEDGRIVFLVENPGGVPVGDRVRRRRSACPVPEQRRRRAVDRGARAAIGLPHPGGPVRDHPSLIW